MLKEGKFHKQQATKMAIDQAMIKLLKLKDVRKYQFLLILVAFANVAVGQDSKKQDLRSAIGLDDVLKISSKLGKNEFDSEFRVIRCFMLPTSKGTKIKAFIAVKTNLLNHFDVPEAFMTLVYMAGNCDYSTKKVLIIGKIKNDENQKYPTIRCARVLETENSSDWRMNASLKHPLNLRKSHARILDDLTSHGCKVKATKWGRPINLAEGRALQMTELDIAGASQKDLIQLSELNSIEKLELSGNFSDIERLANLDSLRTLQITSCNLSGCSVSVLRECEKLSVLDIQNTNLKADFGEFPDDTELSELCLPATGAIEPETISSLRQFGLTRLVAANAGLNNQMIRDIGKMNSVEFLDVSGNSLTKADLELLLKLRSLKKLIVSGPMVADDLRKSYASNRKIIVLSR